MRIIYLDSEYKCHVTDGSDMVPLETDAFDNMCDAMIEGYRFIPEDLAWVRDDGEVFEGEMIAPWKPYEELDEAQREYERQLLAEYAATMADMESALNKLGVTLDETVD